MKYSVKLLTKEVLNFKIKKIFLKQIQTLFTNIDFITIFYFKLYTIYLNNRDIFKGLLTFNWL